MNNKANTYYKRIKRDLHDLIKKLEKDENYYTQLINEVAMPWQLHYQNMREIVRIRLNDLYAVTEDLRRLDDLLEVKE